MPRSRRSDEVVTNLPPRVFHRVHGELWMGPAPAPVRSLFESFDCLVLCAAEYQIPACFPHMETMAVPLYDDGEPMRPQEPYEAVKAAGRVIRWLGEGKRVLVTCWQGRNRSGLVCALALCKGPEAMTPDKAIAKIRKARGPGAMRNESFVNFLFEYCQASESGSSREGRAAGT